MQNKTGQNNEHDNELYEREYEEQGGSGQRKRKGCCVCCLRVFVVVVFVVSVVSREIEIYTLISEQQ